MNYRHIYHAGNFADVMKHITLMLCLAYMKKKDKGFCVIDAHAGCGLYDLASEKAQKTREFEGGIDALLRADNPPAEIKPFLSMAQKDRAKGKYAGSPLIIARQLRNQDRLVAGELHPDDYKMLKMVMGSHRNVTIEKRDAYETLRTFLPPVERRGLILIDPPFEKKDEFETLGRQAKQWAKRFPSGTYLVWYPMKAHLGYNAMREAIIPHFPDWLCFETLRLPEDTPDMLTGSGLLILNPPFGLDRQLTGLRDFMAGALGLHECRITQGHPLTSA